MCEQANIQDAKLTDLCKAIVDSQQKEIDQMKQIHKRLSQ